MTPTELVSKLVAVGPQDLAVVLQCIADNIYDARFFDGGLQLNDQRRLCDLTDVKTWLEQSARAARQARAGQVETTKPAAVLPEQKRWA